LHSAESAITKISTWKVNSLYSSFNNNKKNPYSGNLSSGKRICRRRR
jgi:hypothetical protein